MLGPGQIIDGRFLLQNEIGNGGMGSVYLAVDALENRRVAIKVLAASALNSDNARQRLKREIQILSRLRSSHIARLYSAGTLPDGSPYLVMEYLEGRDLKAELRMRGPLPVAEAVAYVVQACRGVSIAHRAKIVHRDLKPQNLFLTKLDGARQVKVLDFGVAKVLSEATDLNLTATDTAVGTPLYMCPEQLLDAKSISTKADVWALGVILYELLAGFSPFVDDSPGAVIAAITLDDPARLCELRNEVPVGLSAVVDGALTKLPSARIANVNELEQLLLPYSMPPGRVVVSSALQDQTPLCIARPERSRAFVDLRKHIKETIDDIQARDKATLRCLRAAAAVDPTPPAERLSLVPGLRRISSADISVGVRPPELAAAVASKAPGGPSVRNRRLLLAIGGSSLPVVALLIVKIVMAEYQGHSRVATAALPFARITAVAPAMSHALSIGAVLGLVSSISVASTSLELQRSEPKAPEQKSIARHTARASTTERGASDVRSPRTVPSTKTSERPLHL